ncbi:malate/L-lactate dehydrogenase domain-containing protein [Ditylenchus destructor]|nr:malate/L-lactate dehydrogenase domain-containing protein [Ditylenchus destructor]
MTTFMGAQPTAQDIQCLVDEDELRRFVVDCMASIGVGLDHASQLAELLIEADLRGHYSHGLNRLHVYMEDVIGGVNKEGKPKVVKSKGGTAWVDGDNALGVVVGNFCTNLAIQLAKEHGIGWIVANNSNHYGICAHYAKRITNNGFVIEVADRKGFTHIPTQWGANSKGQPTDNPKVVLQGGGLLPLGTSGNSSEISAGYKGTGLAMMVEMFCGLLGGAAYGKNIRKWRGEANQNANLGQCFVALDPECFAPGFADRLQTFINETRTLEPVNPLEPVLVAGDPERQHIALCKIAGGVIYNHSIIDHLDKIASKCDIPPIKFSRIKE